MQWTVHNPYFNYFNPDAGSFFVNNNASDKRSRPLETYLPDDYIKYVKALNETVGFEGKKISKDANLYNMIVDKKLIIINFKCS